MSDTWTIDPADAEAALVRLRNARTVLMPMHQNVDADGLSSPIAMRLALAGYGVDAYPLITDGDFPSNLRFLPEIGSVLVYGKDELPEYDTLCLIDCADRRRLGNFAKDDPSRLDGHIPIVNIDHHITNDRFGIVNIVEPEASSAAEIVAEVLKLWRAEITEDIARALLAGIYGDTLGLRTPSTTPHTIRTVADLVERGAELEPVVDQLFRLKPRSTICLWEHALHNVEWTGPIIWTEMTRDGFQQCGAEMVEAEGIVNFLAGTQGSRVAVILYQDEDRQGWRVSLRGLEKTIDVAAIAAQFGGGGHPRAAGARVEGGEAEKRAFIERVSEIVASIPEPAGVSLRSGGEGGVATLRG